MVSGSRSDDRCLLSTLKVCWHWRGKRQQQITKHTRKTNRVKNIYPLGSGYWLDRITVFLAGGKGALRCTLIAKFGCSEIKNSQSEKMYCPLGGQKVVERSNILHWLWQEILEYEPQTDHLISPASKSHNTWWCLQWQPCLHLKETLIPFSQQSEPSHSN